MLLNGFMRSTQHLTRSKTWKAAQDINLTISRALNSLLMIGSLNRTKKTGPLIIGLYDIISYHTYSTAYSQKLFIETWQYYLSLVSMAGDISPQGLSTLERYKYKPFENNYSIRILTLEPGTGDEPLVGHLGFEHLDSNPQYEAISYCWGTDGRSSEIICDRKPLALTKSIEGALRRMRHATSQRRLWADQVCINQDDIAERSQQVSLMNAIYKGAQRVLVWLGPDSDGVAHAAMTMIHYLDGVFNNEEMHNEFRRAHSEELLKQDAKPWLPFSNMTRLPWVSYFTIHLRWRRLC